MKKARSIFWFTYAVIISLVLLWVLVAHTAEYKREFVFSKSAIGNPVIRWDRNREADIAGYTVYVWNYLKPSAGWVQYTATDTFRVFYGTELKDSCKAYVDAFDWGANHSIGSDTIKIAFRNTPLPPTPPPPPGTYDIPYSAPATWDGWVINKKWAVRVQDAPTLQGKGIYVWYVPGGTFLGSHSTIDRKFSLPTGTMVINFTAQGDVPDVSVSIEDMNGAPVSSQLVRVATIKAAYQVTLGVSTPGTYWLRFIPSGSFFLGAYSHGRSADTTPPARTKGVGVILQ
jgi:hypothetical protein